ncbi:DUF2244 domain-containing protein [Aliiglaciecola lipolytica]|uniref:DUF2244 domain-containing protein n=1 Tax=Aliiglaciecola lipolytica E3 TaxID=1127673 RepID=K6YA67_9ALTE|nr:DUF2244 domain-containing protein [Aliiglaciecola lipolytica]GAC13558.1 hypothetical protein GLIP_0915 [Aliiglaciecola lipolytica E3]
MVKQFTQNNQTTITLSANRSATWNEVKLVVLLMAAFTFMIAIIWALLGVWLILPFAGFEVALLAFLMYRVNLNCLTKQIITIDATRIVVECGIRKPTITQQLDRRLTHLSVIEAQGAFDRPQMKLADENCSIPLGPFLNQTDCIIARDLLNQLGIIEVSNKWWKQR